MKKKKIMIVEDEMIFVRDLEFTLTQNGFQITSHHDNAKSALAAIKADKPDLVLIDIALVGEMNGIDLANKIKNEIPFIFLTVHTDEKTIAKANEIEPKGYITKPLLEDELLESINLVFE
jgi:DNA-binding NarL/FixJ family response regulator